MLEWMTAKVSRIRNRFEEESTSSPSPLPSTTTTTNTNTNGNSTDNDPAHLKFKIQQKMHLYYTRHNVLGNDLPFKNLDPCPICLVRYATIQTQPCTHGRICKYCAYRFLDSAVNDVVKCSICRKRIIGFIQLSRNPNATCDNDQFIKRSFSIHDYSDSSEEYHVNRGYETSESNSF